MIRLRGQLVSLSDDEAQAVRSHLPDHMARTRDSAWFADTPGIQRDFRMEERGD